MKHFHIFDRDGGIPAILTCELGSCASLNPDGTCPNGYGATCEAVVAKSRPSARCWRRSRPKMREGFAVAWRTWFGLPDGYLIRLRCWVFGHDLHVCHDTCCDGECVWCHTCQRPFSEPHAFRKRPEGGDRD